MNHKKLVIVVVLAITAAFIWVIAVNTYEGRLYAGGIDYKKYQSEVKKIIGWEGKRAEKDKKANLDRLTGIDVKVEMVY